MGISGHARRPEDLAPCLGYGPVPSLRLSVEGDSVTALYLLVVTKSRSDVNDNTAKEVDMALGAATYRPDRVRHIPGTTTHIPRLRPRR